MLPAYDADAIAELLGLDPGLDLVGAPEGRPKGINRSGTREPGPAPSYMLREEGTPMMGSDIEPLSAVSIEAAVENGLPRSTLRHVAEWLAGNDTAKIAPLEWTVVPKTTLERRIGKLSVPESERTERIARLAVQARRSLGTTGEARDFMTAPHPELDGRTPVEAARTDLGARRVERILLALEYGLAL